MLRSIYNKIESLTYKIVHEFISEIKISIKKITKEKLNSYGIFKKLRLLLKNIVVMFDGYSSLINLDINSFNITNVVEMYRMFYGCSSF